MTEQNVHLGKREFVGLYLGAI